MAKNDTPKSIRCSFCGKAQENVRKIVAGSLYDWTSPFIAPYTLSITKVNGNSSKWVKSVTLTVEASSSNGLNSKAYSFDGGKTYQSSNSKTFTNNQTVNIVIRDIKGNKTSKKVRINKIDNTKPKVSINATNKTSNSVVLNAVTNPNNSISGYKYQWYKVCYGSPRWRFFSIIIL